MFFSALLSEVSYRKKFVFETSGAHFCDTASNEICLVTIVAVPKPEFVAVVADL